MQYVIYIIIVMHVSVCYDKVVVLFLSLPSKHSKTSLYEIQSFMPLSIEVLLYLQLLLHHISSKILECFLFALKQKKV